MTLQMPKRLIGCANHLSPASVSSIWNPACSQAFNSRSEMLTQNLRLLCTRLQWKMLRVNHISFRSDIFASKWRLLYFWPSRSIITCGRIIKISVSKIGLCHMSNIFSRLKGHIRNPGLLSKKCSGLEKRKLLCRANAKIYFLDQSMKWYVARSGKRLLPTRPLLQRAQSHWCATSEEIGQNPIHFCDLCGFKILELLESAVKHSYIFQIYVLLTTRIQNREKS